MRTFVKAILRILAKLTLARYKPRVVAITGSVGKTSTKEAIAAVLKSRYSIRATTGNYNNEIGLPLTIIGEESAGKNPLGWIWIFIKSVLKLLGSHYPQVLILELGTDHPGDINYLTGVIGDIDAAVITDIGISHLEFFSSRESLAKEKISLIKKLRSNAAAILNFDNPKVLEGKNLTKAEVIGYGFSDAHVKATDFNLIRSGNQWGSNFKVHYRGTVVPFFLPQALGAPAVYAALAAIAVGIRFNLNLVQASEALQIFSPPPGRLRLLDGIKHTTIIDDTYNAAPASTIAAIQVLTQISFGRKLAAIGSMAELGKQTETGHREVAAKIVESHIDLVFLVGENAKIIGDELNKRQFAGRAWWFETSDQACIPIQDALLEGDTILIKGSQSARMEKIVKEIMADPMRAESLLVRQSEKWANIP